MEPARDESEAPLDAEEWRDKALRALAELENMRKRKTKEIEQARDQGETFVATKFLEVVDDFQRALASMADAKEVDQISRTELIDGVQRIFGKFIAVLKQLEIEGFKTEGQRFAAELMEAIAQVPTKSLPPGTVATEFSQGFTRRGRLLRAAQVGVAVPEEEGSGEESDPS